MQIEGLVLLVGEVLDVMDVDEAVEGGGYDVVQVGVELDLRDPALVNLLFDRVYPFFDFLKSVYLLKLLL